MNKIQYQRYAQRWQTPRRLRECVQVLAPRCDKQQQQQPPTTQANTDLPEGFFLIVYLGKIEILPERRGTKFQSREARL